MDGSGLAANVVKDLKGFIYRVLSVVNAMNSQLMIDAQRQQRHGIHCHCRRCAG
jgi:hypothetical protein